MANRYFVGAGSWDNSDTTVWSDTSGGTTGFSVPTSADDVFFDANSGNCAISASVECDDLNFTGYISTLSGSSPLGIYGSLTLAAGMTRTYSGSCTMRATSGTKTITSNGKAWTSGTMIFNGVGGTFQLIDQYESVGSLTLTNGTFDANGQTVLLNGIGTAHTITGAFTFFNLTKAGSSGGQLIFTTNCTIAGTFSCTQTSRVFIRSSVIGTAQILTVATNSLQWVSFRDITAAGAASWNLSAITGESEDCGGNTGIIFTSPKNRYWVGGTGNWNSTGEWSATSGGASGASVPIAQDTAIFNASSFSAGSQVVTVNQTRICAMDWTGATNTPTLTTSTASEIYGSITLISGMTLTASTQTYSLLGRGTHTLTSAGKTWNKSFTIDAPGGTWTLQDDLNIGFSQLVTLTRGTFNANNFNVTAYGLSASNTNVRTLNLGNGIWTLGGGGSVWSLSNTTNLTFNAGLSTIVFNEGTTTGKQFLGGGLTYYNFTISGAGIANYTISGSNTFNKIESTKTVAHGFLFTAGTTQSVADFVVEGTAGNLVTINSNTTGTHALTKTGGGRIISDYLNIQHSIATPANTWYAGLNSTDNQAVATAGSGWLFSIPLPTVTTQAVSSITDATSVGNGNITDDGSGTVTERGFVYDLATKSAPSNVSPASSGYASVATDTGTFTEGAFTKLITGLTPLTTYYVRAYCLNEAGYDYGDEVSFATGETPEVAIVTTQDPTSVTATTATGNGTIVDANGTVTRRGFAVSTTSHSDPSNTDPDVSDYEVVFSASGSFTEGAYTTSLTGLTIDTLYYIRAFTENGEGFSYGSELNFMTDRKPSVTIQAPTNRQSTTVNLNGTVTDAGGDDIDSRGFVWDTATQLAPGDVAPASSGYDFTQGETGTLTAGAFDEAITGLDPNTTYYVRAYAQNTQGYTYTDEISFSTITFPNTTIIINEDTNTVTPTNTETTPISGIINQSTNTASIINQDI